MRRISTQVPEIEALLAGPIAHRAAPSDADDERQDRVVRSVIGGVDRAIEVEVARHRDPRVVDVLAQRDADGRKDDFADEAVRVTGDGPQRLRGEVGARRGPGAAWV